MCSYLFVNIIDTIKTPNQLLYLSFWNIMLNIKYIIKIKSNNCFNKVFDVGKFISLYSKVTSVKRSLWVPPAGDCLIQVWLYIPFHLSFFSHILPECNPKYLPSRSILYKEDKIHKLSYYIQKKSLLRLFNSLLRLFKVVITTFNLVITTFYLVITTFYLVITT
jgi:hypothetical protein